MAKIIVFPTTRHGRADRRGALEQAAKIQRSLGGRIVARPYRGRPDPDGDGPRAA